jgi:hypothetical protein
VIAEGVWLICVVIGAPANFTSAKTLFSWLRPLETRAVRVRLEVICVRTVEAEKNALEHVVSLSLILHCNVTTVIETVTVAGVSRNMGVKCGHEINLVPFVEVVNRSVLPSRG